MKEKVKKISGISALILFVFALCGLVGRMDADDEHAAFKQYCADVSDGVYPDYKKQLDYCD